MTEIPDAEEAAWSILDRPGAVTQWCVIKLGGEGALLCTKSPRRQYRQSGLQVGCSFVLFARAASQVLASLRLGNSCIMYEWQPLLIL